MWLGGNSPSELRRTGRLGDGWLPSFCSVADVRDGWPVINATAAEHGREIDPEHLGVLIAYSRSAVPDAVKALIATRRPDLDPTDVVPIGLPARRSPHRGHDRGRRLEVRRPPDRGAARLGGRARGDRLRPPPPPELTPNGSDAEVSEQRFGEGFEDGGGVGDGEVDDAELHAGGLVLGGRVGEERRVDARLGPQVRGHEDLRRVPADVRAVAAQHLELVDDVLGRAARVVPVLGQAGDAPQRAALAECRRCRSAGAGAGPASARSGRPSACSACRRSPSSCSDSSPMMTSSASSKRSKRSFSGGRSMP